MRGLALFIALIFAVSSPAQAQTTTSTVEGILVPARAWDISAEVNNKINRLHFIEGQVVSKGDLLVEFDAGFKALELELAEAQLAKVKVVLDEAVDKFSRQEQLRDKEAVSEAGYSTALFAVRAAKADYKSLKVQRDMAELILKAQKLYAPFDGQMSAPRYRENANVNIEHSRSIATIVQLDPIHLRAPVQLKRILFRLQSGRSEAEIAEAITVRLNLPDGSQYPHSGKIVSTSYGLENSSQEAVVIVEFPNPDKLLRPGMKVVATGYENTR